MSLSPFFHHDLHAHTDTPVRVFPAIAPIPALPALRWWNHPLLLLPATVVLTVNLTHLPALPAATIPVILALSAILTTLGTCSYFAWDDSHHAARTEAAWIAAQSGYHLHTHHDGRLSWTTPQTTPQPATLTPTPTGWDLTLTHHPYPPTTSPQKGRVPQDPRTPTTTGTPACYRTEAKDHGRDTATTSQRR